MSGKCSEKQAKAFEMLDKGYSVKQIMQELGVGKTTVYKWVARKRDGNRSYQEDSFTITAEQCKEWDDFMGRPVRPIRLAGENNEQATA